MKKSLVLTTLVILLTIALAACSSGGLPTAAPGLGGTGTPTTGPGMTQPSGTATPAAPASGGSSP